MKDILLLPLWTDISPRSYTKPTVVRFRTPVRQFSWSGPVRVLYAVCGTDYGYIHNIDGDVRVWRTYSGAYKAMRKHVSI